MKTCRTCKLEKEKAAFCLHPNGKDGFSTLCKECKKEYRRSEKSKEYDRKYKKTEKYKKYAIEYGKKYKRSQIYKSWRIKYVKERILSDMQFKISLALRSRLSAAIKNNVKIGSSVTDLGCSIKFLKHYLENRFEEGMTWSNWKRDGWHIDHILPLTHFDLTDREQFLQAVHYTNLQPLWAHDNYKKSNLMQLNA